MKTRKDPPPPLPVLIDTPIWRSYFLRTERTFREVNALMDAGRICCLDLIVGELLGAADTEEEIKVLRDLTRVFPLLQDPPGAWVEAARLAFRLRQRGKALSLRDAYLAFMAQAHGVLLYTDNQKVRQAQKALALKLKFFPPKRSSE
jgi:predicted nucleic acid-binding protein